MTTHKLMQDDTTAQHAHSRAPLPNVIRPDFERSKAAGDILIVTSYPDRFFELDGVARIVETCKEAWDLIERASFSAIFCDMGQLGPTESGFRFASALARIETQPHAFLMADQITENNHKWAIRQGALGLIVRSPGGIRQVLREIGLAAADAADVTAAGSRGDTPRGIAPGFAVAVVTQLQCHIGPIAEDLVGDTVRRLSDRYPESVSPALLIDEVASYIDDPNDRQQFVQSINALHGMTRT